MEDIVLCDFGCGNRARFIFKNGRRCCSRNHSSCPTIKKKFSDSNCMKRPEMRIIAGNSMRGKKRNLEIIKIVADKIRGRKHTEDSKRKMSDKAKGRIIPEHQRKMMRDNNPMKNIETIKKMVESNRKIKEERGIWIKREYLNDLEIYRREVDKYTRRSIKEKYTKEELKNRGWYKNLNTHVDHIFSITKGFKLNIDPKIIGSKSNIRMISVSENCKKYIRCDITKEELFKKYEKEIEVRRSEL
jgi:hypothetical protein